MSSEDAYEYAWNAEKSFGSDHKDGDELIISYEYNRGWKWGYIFDCWIQTAVKAVDVHMFIKWAEKKFKRKLPIGKPLISTVFWDKKGMLMVEFIKQNIVMKSQMYCKILKILCRAIRKKKCEMLTSSVALLHDKTLPHTAAWTRVLLQYFNWELCYHLPYSPDLAPIDWHLFAYLQNSFESKHFNNNEEMMQDVKTWLSSHATDLFDKGIH
jgi:histone-lysine N-methyltransferase SETMAR